MIGILHIDRTGDTVLLFSLLMFSRLNILAGI